MTMCPHTFGQIVYVDFLTLRNNYGLQRQHMNECVMTSNKKLSDMSMWNSLTRNPCSNPVSVTRGPWSYEEAILPAASTAYIYVYYLGSEIDFTTNHTVQRINVV